MVTDVLTFLGGQTARAVDAGIDRSRLWVDPGIGFGKTLEHNLALLAALDRFAALGYPVLVGASRKRFIGEISGDPVGERLGGSLAAIAGIEVTAEVGGKIHAIHFTSGDTVKAGELLLELDDDADEAATIADRTVLLADL